MGKFTRACQYYCHDAAGRRKGGGGQGGIVAAGDSECGREEEPGGREMRTRGRRVTDGSDAGAAKDDDEKTGW